MRQITINGHTYKSISAACRELNPPVPEITIRWRLNHGWSPELAFETEAVPAPHRANRRSVLIRHNWYGRFL